MSDSEHSDVEIDRDEEVMALDPTNVRERIDQTLEQLATLKTNRDRTVARSDLLALLSKDLVEYFGYLPELCELLMSIFSPAECLEYMEASDRPRPIVIRTNTLKTNRKQLMAALTKRGVNLEAIDWSKVAIKITESTVPIGATPEYLAGHYMLQSAASMNPVMALAPVPGERVLDMSSAPGGKTSYVAQLMKNSGTVVANDLKPERQKATIGNLHRMGIKNSIVCSYDGRKFQRVMKGFDRVLLDAPCSGLGVISRDQSVKLQRTVKDIQRSAHLQKELLCVAVDCCDSNSATGGIIVYSTCSISVEENEQVIQYILNKRHVKLIETGLEVGKPGFTRYQDKRFHPSLELTRRFYPHVHNMDGFFVAKLKKLKNGVKGDDEVNEQEEELDIGDEDMDEVFNTVTSETLEPVNKKTKKVNRKEESSVVAVEEPVNKKTKKINRTEKDEQVSVAAVEVEEPVNKKAKKINRTEKVEEEVVRVKNDLKPMKKSIAKK